MKADYEHQHAVVDAACILGLAVAPSITGATPVFSTVCWSVALVLAAMCGATEYPLGLFRFVPADAHHAFETSLGIGVLFSALLFGVAGLMLDQFVLAAIAVVLIGAGVHGLWVGERPAHGPRVHATDQGVSQ